MKLAGEGLGFSTPSWAPTIDIVNPSASLSIIDAVDELLLLTVPTEGEEIVAIKVSVISKMLSSVTEIVNVTELTPSGMAKAVTPV